ncbi:PAP2 family protein, partial [Streptomyces sp. SID6013]|nr:PAP2 family protein [Streptomyces sp. SID6013]
ASGDAPAAAAGSAPATASATAADGAGSANVSGGCQTSAGERFPRQREQRLGAGAEPDPAPSDAGDETPAPAR